MIPHLPPPSICVIDDEESEYRPILEALQQLGLGCVHVNGATAESVPSQPLRGLRIVFTDLHLSTAGGKTAASHTANVFSHVVPIDTPPLVVIIWSKYKDEKVPDDGAPADEEPTEAERFRDELLGTIKEFQGRLVFLEMSKPKPGERPEVRQQWIEELKLQIGKTLAELQGFHALWTWESLVREAAAKVSGGVTTLALSMEESTQDASAYAAATNRNIQSILSLLAKAQAGPDFMPETAPPHLGVALAHLLMDYVEHASPPDYGEWLGRQEETGTDQAKFVPHINKFLLTGAAASSDRAFVPGTVYQVQFEGFEAAFQKTPLDLIRACCSKKEGPNFDKFTKSAAPILVEVSPACDFHQRSRCCALLIAGLLLPVSEISNTAKGDKIFSLPRFTLRTPEGMEPHFLVFCSHYKLTLPEDREPAWLKPWFRLRELPLASLRNWHSGHASRIGYPVL